MTFDVKQEASYIVGETEFYLFDFGSFVERYTTKRKKTTAFGFEWLPLPIRRAGFDDDFSLKAETPKLTMPVRRSFIELTVSGGLDAVRVTIIRGFGTDYVNDYRNPWWTGWLVNVLVGVRSVEGTLEDARTFFDADFPRVRHQAACNNVLFDGRCGLNPASFTETRTVLAIGVDGLLLTLSGAIPGVADYFSLGRIRKTGTGDFWRQITQQVGDQYALYTAIPGLVVGDSVDVRPGCDLSPQTCASKYNNKNNYVGMPNIPVVNPVTGGL